MVKGKKTPGVGKKGQKTGGNIIRDRVRELRRVQASTLVPHPKNWRTHPPHQREALREILGTVGYADALIARETPDGRLVLLDGHLRREETPDALVPVLIVDLDDAEADRVLASLDPLASMAGVDSEKLQALLQDINLTGPLEEFLGGLAEAGGLPVVPASPANDPGAEWLGMPEFEHEDKTAFRSITVHFKDQDAVDSFAELIGQKIPEKARFLWFPEAEIERYADKRYAT